MDFKAVCIVLGLLLGFALAINPLDRSDCSRNSYRKHTLKLIKEVPFAGLFRDLKNQTKFEASGVANVRGHFYVVFDSSMSLGFLDDRFSFRGTDNMLIGDFIKESQFEGLAYVPENDTFLLLHEVLPEQGVISPSNTFRPSITTAKIHPDNSGYDMLSQCDVDFELTHENKGFESIQYIRTIEGESYLLGLCEGNFCEGGKAGADAGNGRIVVSQMDEQDGNCIWVPVKTIEVPSSAFFRDYSAMALNMAIGKMAILSQEDAAVWIGDFDVDGVNFSSEEGEIFHLPRDNHCEMVYCNAEGIQWLDNYRFVVASDKAKKDQPFWCDAKDQSIHLFALPPAWDPWVSAKANAINFNDEEGEEERRNGEESAWSGGKYGPGYILA